MTLLPSRQRISGQYAVRLTATAPGAQPVLVNHASAKVINDAHAALAGALVHQQFSFVPGLVQYRQFDGRSGLCRGKNGCLFIPAGFADWHIDVARPGLHGQRHRFGGWPDQRPVTG